MSQKKQDLWRKRIEDYQSSGLTGTKWCLEQNVSEHQFWYWKKRLGTVSSKKRSKTEWVPLMNRDSILSTLTIRIGIVEIEVKSGYDATLLQDVVKTLMFQC